MKIEIHWNYNQIETLPVSTEEEFAHCIQQLFLADSQYVTIRIGRHERRVDKGDIDHIRIWIL